MKITAAILIVAIALISSCRVIMRKTIGIENPQMQSKKSVFAYLVKNGMDTTDVYCMDTTTFDKLQNEPFKPGWKAGFRPLQIRCYDAVGVPIMQWSSCEGYLTDLKTFDSTPPKNYNGLNTTLRLKDDLAQYCDFSGNREIAKFYEDSDYTILVFFSLWTQGLQKKIKMFEEVNKFVKNNSDKKIRVYKINYDVHPFWNTELKTKFSIGIGGAK